MENKYRLSVIIPTKNRQKYCMQVIRQITGATSKATELVIQDNSDDGSIGDFCRELNCERVVYHYESRVLSFVDNFSEAVKLAHGEYVCIIGDDDCVLPNIERAVEYAVEKDLDCLVPGLNSVYIWPNPTPIVPGAQNGYLVLTYIKNKKVDIDLDKGIVRLLELGCQDYQTLDVPRVYHGLVRRSALEAVVDKIGSYFGGLSPDIYIAVALAFVCRKVERVHYPITVSGICPGSGSSNSATGAHTGELRDAPHFRGHDSYTWEPLVPALYTVETIWADTALHAVRDFEKEALLNRFSVLQLDALLWLKYPQFRERVLQHAAEHGYGRQAVISRALALQAAALATRVGKRLIRRRGEVVKHYDVTQIALAAQITMAAVDNVTQGDTVK